MLQAIIIAIQILILCIAGCFSSFRVMAQDTAPTITAVEKWPEPKTPEAFLRRGNEYARLKIYPLAVQDASSALALKPDWVPALRLRARAAYGLKDYDGTVKDCDAVLRQFPDWPQVYNLRGLAYSYSGRHDLAIPDYTQAIKLDPYVAAPYNNRGWAYLETGEVQRAIQDLNHAIELSPDYVRAHSNRAKALDKQNDFEKELVDLEDVMRLDPQNQWARDQHEAVAQRIGLNGTRSVEGTPSELPITRVEDNTAKVLGVTEVPANDAGVKKPAEGVSAPVPLYKPEPSYTSRARKAKISGDATFMITVDASGNVTGANEVSPKLGDGLDENAVKTLYTWKFKPALRNGIPVPVRVMVRIQFKLF